MTLKRCQGQSPIKSVKSALYTLYLLNVCVFYTQTCLLTEFLDLMALTYISRSHAHIEHLILFY